MVGLAAVLIACLLLAGNAGAATLFFQAVPTTASAACPAPCYQIWMFYEDATRSLPVRALNIDVDVFGGASVAVLPIFPATSSTVANGNARENTNFTLQPWNLFSAVARSPDPDFDARTVGESDPALTVDFVSELFVDGCTGPGCAAITADYRTSDNADFDGNGIGDPCECGDQTQDAVVNVLDILGINLVIFGAVQKSPLCDTNYDGLCNVQDIVGATQKIFGTPAYCSRYPPPGP